MVTKNKMMKGKTALMTGHLSLRWMACSHWMIIWPVCCGSLRFCLSCACCEESTVSVSISDLDVLFWFHGRVVGDETFQVDIDADRRQQHERHKKLFTASGRDDGTIRPTSTTFTARRFVPIVYPPSHPLSPSLLSSVLELDTSLEMDMFDMDPSTGLLCLSGVDAVMMGGGHPAMWYRLDRMVSSRLAAVERFVFGVAGNVPGGGQWPGKLAAPLLAHGVGQNADVSELALLPGDFGDDGGMGLLDEGVFDDNQHHDENAATGGDETAGAGDEVVSDVDSKQMVYDRLDEWRLRDVDQVGGNSVAPIAVVKPERPSTFLSLSVKNGKKKWKKEQSITNNSVWCGEPDYIRSRARPLAVGASHEGVVGEAAQSKLSLALQDMESSGGGRAEVKALGASGDSGTAKSDERELVTEACDALFAMVTSPLALVADRRSSAPCIAFIDAMLRHKWNALHAVHALMYGYDDAEGDEGTKSGAVRSNVSLVRSVLQGTGMGLLKQCWGIPALLGTLLAPDGPITVSSVRTWLRSKFSSLASAVTDSSGDENDLCSGLRAIMCGTVTPNGRGFIKAAAQLRRSLRRSIMVRLCPCG